MLEATRSALLERIRPEDVVLDIGSWADPFERADWVIDMYPYETRGLYRRNGWVPERPAEPERFSRERWIERDVCDREPFPFADDEIDFVICSHTLEDVRDPVWVCSEMRRVAKRGYIEVPSRLEEQSWGVGGGEFAGWPHHHWLIDIDREAGSIEFVFKQHVLHSMPECCFPHDFWERLAEEEKVQSLWWEGGFDFRERTLEDAVETLLYLRELVDREVAARGYRRPPPVRSLAGRVRDRAAMLAREVRAAAAERRRPPVAEAESMREFWDSRAEENSLFFVDNTLDYRASDPSRFWARAEAELDSVLGPVGAELHESDRVVEIGCGVGRLTRVIASRAAEVRALDVSPRMLERARQHLGGLDNVELILGDGLSLAPIEDASADACISHVVFQHIPDPEITLGYVREIGRVLRPGGWAAFQISNDPAIHRRRDGIEGLGIRWRALRGRGPRGQADPAWLGSYVELGALRDAAADAGMAVEAISGEGTQLCFVRVRRAE